MPSLGRKTKAVKLTSACYPEQENAPIIGSNLDALIKYALMTPQKLAEIGKYVEKRVMKAIIKKQYGYLKISLEIFRAIINSCTANLLTFYAPYVVSSLHEIMKQYKKVGNTNTAFFNDILIMASETFIEFAKQRFNNNITEYQDLGFFLAYFTDMSSYESPDKDQKKKMRLVGLNSLYTYITTIEDLDTFVAKYVDITKHTPIIHTILSNLLEYFKEVEPDERKSVKKLSFSCLTELARSVSPITIQTLLTAIISFLDSKQVWMNRDFANEAIRATSVKQQHNQIIISQLLLHLDDVNDYETKVAIVNTIVFFFESIAKGPIGPVVEVLIPLVAQLLASVSASAPASPGSTTENPSELLQSTIVKCIGGVGKRVADPSEKLEAMTYIIDKLRGNEGNTKATSLLLQCVLQIAVNFTQLPSSRDLPAKIVQSMLNLSTSTDPTIRILVQQIFQSLLKAATKLLQSGTGYDPTEVQKRDQSIRFSLYKQILLDNNEPENFYVIYETLVVLLSAYRAQELQFSLPIMFKLESTVVSEKTLPSHIRTAVHSVVAAYLLHVAKLFDCGGLEEYIRGLLNLKEETSDFNSKVFSLKEGSFGLKKKVWKKKYLKKEVEEIKKPIEKDVVIEHLGKCPLVTQEFPNKDVSQLFAREMTEDAMMMVSTIEITTQRKKDQRKSERPRSDTTTEPRAAVNVITAETFTKIFESEKTEEHEVLEETLSRSSGRSGKKKEARSSAVIGTPIRKNTVTTVSPHEEFVIPAHSYATTVAMRNRQLNDLSMNKEYLFSLIPEAPKDGIELGPSSTVNLVYPNLLHATLI